MVEAINILLGLELLVVLPTLTFALLKRLEDIDE